MTSSQRIPSKSQCPSAGGWLFEPEPSGDLTGSCVAVNRLGLWRGPFTPNFIPHSHLHDLYLFITLLGYYVNVGYYVNTRTITDEGRKDMSNSGLFFSIASCCTDGVKEYNNYTVFVKAPPAKASYFSLLFIIVHASVKFVANAHERNFDDTTNTTG